jgi:large subunit ribosomal protein L4
MKAAVYNQQGEKISEALLPKDVFGVEMNQDLLYQVVVAQTANRRRVIAHAKSRAEVSGGGIKPWRQKGTGRARHGSTRSPLWRHGGVTFGPTKDRVFKLKINAKMRRAALLMVLSSKALKEQVIFLDNLKLEKAKTKVMAEILKKLPVKSESALIALPELHQDVVLAARNLPKTKTLPAKDLNALDLLNFKYLVMPKDSLKVIKDTFIK